MAGLLLSSSVFKSEAHRSAKSQRKVSKSWPPTSRIHNLTNELLIFQNTHEDVCQVSECERKAGGGGSVPVSQRRGLALTVVSVKQLAQ